MCVHGVYVYIYVYFMTHDIWYMTYDMWYVICDTWNMTYVYNTWDIMYDIWFMIHDTWYIYIGICMCKMICKCIFKCIFKCICMCMCICICCEWDSPTLATASNHWSRPFFSRHSHSFSKSECHLWQWCTGYAKACHGHTKSSQALQIGRPRPLSYGTTTRYPSQNHCPMALLSQRVLWRIYHGEFLSKRKGQHVQLESMVDATMMDLHSLKIQVF